MALTIQIFGPIGEGGPSSKGKNGVYSATTPDGLQAALDANPDEKDVRIDLNSPGGSVLDGLAMYDVLRTSGRNVFTNIVGGCHSIASILLLAAPAVRRSSNPHGRSLLHLVRTDPGGAATSAELAQIAETNQREEDRIVQIYAERTKLTESQARTLIQAEKIHTAQDLLRMGFISKINQYTTNSLTNKKTNTMTKNRKEGATLLERIGGFLVNAAKILSPVNFDYEDADGNVLFSTASESDDLAVGMEVAFPDETTGGTFDLPDGRVVTIEDLVVTAIDDAPSEEIEALRAENEALKAQLSEAVNLVEEMKGQIGSTYTPQNRTTRPTTATRTARQAAATVKDPDAFKNALKESHTKAFGKKITTT